MIHFLAPRQSVDVPLDYIARGGLEGRADVIAIEDLPSRDTLPWGLYVLTGINRLGPFTARFLASLLGQIEEGTGMRPLNHPLHTLRRYELLRVLHREGLNDFTAYGAWEDYSMVRLPAFVRPREADGGIPELMHTLKEIEAAVGEALLNGRRAEEIIVVEFEDTSVDGRFTKYSAYTIGGTIVPVTLDRGTKWVMRRHASSMTEERIKAEERYVMDEFHTEQLRRIFSLSRTDFGRMDYSIKNGRVVCWEINTLPLLRRPHGVRPRPPEVRELMQPRRERVREAMVAAFARILPTASDGPPVRPVFDGDLVAAARRELVGRGATTEAGPPSFPRIRALLRPLKPVLRPLLSATLQPLMARRVRRRASDDGRTGPTRLPGDGGRSDP